MTEEHGTRTAEHGTRTAELGRRTAAGRRFSAEEAAEELLREGADPEAGLPQEVIGEIGPYAAETETDLPGRILDLLGKALADLEPLGLREAIRDLGLLLSAALLSALIRTHGGGLTEAAGCLAVSLICAGGFRSMLGLGRETVEQIHSYLRLLLPGLGALMAASGRLSGSGSVIAGALLAFDVLTALLSGLVIPLISLRAALSAAEAALGADNLEKLRDFLKWAVNSIYKLVFWGFSGILTLTDLFSASADARQVRVLRSAISGMVPGVGAVVSEASRALVSAADSLRASVGTYGLLAVATLCLTPLLRIWLRYLTLRLAAALGGLLGKGRTVDLMGKMAELMGSVLTAAGIACILAMLSLSLCVRTVTA